LKDVTAIGPLDSLELGPAGAQEPDRAVAPAQGRTRCPFRADAVGATAPATTGTPASASDTSGFLQFIFCALALGLSLGLDLGLGERLGVGGEATRTTDERRVELIDIPRMLQRAGQVSSLDRALAAR
jgi:hypothetical protein